SFQPDMIHGYALHLSDRFTRSLGSPVRVFADAWVAMNGRPARRLVDPTVDLARVPRSLRRQDWIMPLENEGGGDVPQNARP
ncbi:MAG: HTTM domain-containing protein, partial [Myxococcales bacterium]|nr:HTTM domain-containing protein [Myxococcales bacterium]